MQGTNYTGIWRTSTRSRLYHQLLQPLQKQLHARIAALEGVPPCTAPAAAADAETTDVAAAAATPAAAATDPALRNASLMRLFLVQNTLDCVLSLIDG